MWGWDWDHQTYSREGYGSLGFMKQQPFGRQIPKSFVGRTEKTEPKFWSNSHLSKKIAGDCETTVFRGALVVAWTRRVVRRSWMWSSRDPGLWLTIEHVGPPLSVDIPFLNWPWRFVPENRPKRLKRKRSYEPTLPFLGEICWFQGGYIFFSQIFRAERFSWKLILWNEWKTEVARWFEYDRKRWYFFDALRHARNPEPPTN